MLNCKLVDTPMDPNIKLVPGQAGASTRSMEILTTTGETELSHHHLTEHFLSCEGS